MIPYILCKISNLSEIIWCKQARCYISLLRKGTRSPFYNFASLEPCKFVVCANHTKCQEQADGSTMCLCQTRQKCPAEQEPVCGSNRKTYDNECLFRADACGSDMTFKKGRCGKSSFVILVHVIAWARGQLRINFTHIFKVFTKLPESRSDEGNLENFENTSEINP